MPNIGVSAFSRANAARELDDFRPRVIGRGVGSTLPCSEVTIWANAPVPSINCLKRNMTRARSGRRRDHFGKA